MFDKKWLLIPGGVGIIAFMRIRDGFKIPTVVHFGGSRSFLWRLNIIFILASNNVSRFCFEFVSVPKSPIADMASSSPLKWATSRQLSSSSKILRQDWADIKYNIEKGYHLEVPASSMYFVTLLQLYLPRTFTLAAMRQI